MLTLKKTGAKNHGSIIKSYKGFSRGAYAHLSGSQKTVAVFCNIVFSLYIAIISSLGIFDNILQSFTLALSGGFLVFIAVYQLIKLFLLHWSELKISYNAQRGAFHWKTFFSVSVIVFSMLAMNLLVQYPGGINPDNIQQWTQVQSGAFSNWHPAIHTMIIWLVSRIALSYTFCIGFQMLCFSLICGYMAGTLMSWGIKKYWVWGFVITVISPRVTRNIMLFVSNDAAFTLFVTCLAVFMVNITLSKGKWLTKWYNTAAFALVAAMASVIRHNGFFFTAPLGLFIIIAYGKTTRNAVYSAAASLLAVLFIVLGLYPMAKVAYIPSQTYVESVGLPMTVLSGVMIKEPDALDPQAKILLEKITDYQTWKSTYQSGNFNSIRYIMPTSDAILEFTPRELFLMTFRTVIAAPKQSLSEVIALTKTVWSPLNWNHDIEVYAEESARGQMYTSDELYYMQPFKRQNESLYNLACAVVEAGVLYRILTPIGLHMLLLLFAGIYSVNRNLKGKALFLFLPAAAYNLGAMLLLFGPDYRFFHFNTVITLPLIIALLAKSGAVSEKADERAEECAAAASEG